MSGGFVFLFNNQKVLPEELSTRGSYFNQTASQTFSFHHGGHCGQSVALDQPAGDSCWSSAFPRWNNDSKPIVPATPHSSTSSIHHETDQETENWEGVLGMTGKQI